MNMYPPRCLTTFGKSVLPKVRNSISEWLKVLTFSKLTCDSKSLDVSLIVLDSAVSEVVEHRPHPPPVGWV